MTCTEARALMLECLTGSTPPDTRRALQAHLQTCPACVAEAQGVEETVALLHAAPDPHLSEGQWAEFSHALQLRIDRESLTVWARFRGWLQVPRVAWGMAAATATLAVVLVVTTVFHSTPPRAQLVDLPAPLRGLVTESMRRSSSSMATTLDLWNAQLAEAPTEAEAAGGN